MAGGFLTGSVRYRVASKHKYPRGPGSWLETACFAEVTALSARKHDLLSVVEQKTKAFIFEET